MHKRMQQKLGILVLGILLASAVGGRAFADNIQGQGSVGDGSPNTAVGSNNDVLSGNQTDSNNVQPFASFNDASTNDSGNANIPITSSFNDSSTRSYDSHNDYSTNQGAQGQVNLNGSTAEDINAADNQSTIFDGDVYIGSGGWDGGYNNVNTGVMENSIQGNGSAQFTNVGNGLNNSEIHDSSLNSSQNTNVNVVGREFSESSRISPPGSGSFPPVRAGLTPVFCTKSNASAFLKKKMRQSTVRVVGRRISKFARLLTG